MFFFILSPPAVAFALALTAVVSLAFFALTVALTAVLCLVVHSATSLIRGLLRVHLVVLLLLSLPHCLCVAVLWLHSWWSTIISIMVAMIYIRRSRCMQVIKQCKGGGQIKFIGWDRRAAE